MVDPIQALMDEHRVILRVLDAVEAAAERTAPLSFYERVLEFFTKHFDARHRAKEEDRLFPLLERRGVVRIGGPIGVSCHEHVCGRRHLRRMREFLERQDRAGLRAESLRYVSMLRLHIQKEDAVLFSLARGVLSAEDVEQLEREFAEIENAARGPGFAEVAAQLCSQGGSAS